MSWYLKFWHPSEEELIARENARTYRMIRSLPEEVQKDIGWPDAQDSRRIRNRASVS